MSRLDRPPATSAAISRSRLVSSSASGWPGAPPGPAAVPARSSQALRGAGTLGSASSPATASATICSIGVPAPRARSSAHRPAPSARAAAAADRARCPSMTGLPPSLPPASSQRAWAAPSSQAERSNRPSSAASQPSRSSAWASPTGSPSSCRALSASAAAPAHSGRRPGCRYSASAEVIAT